MIKTINSVGLFNKGVVHYWQHLSIYTQRMEERTNPEHAY